MIERLQIRPGDQSDLPSLGALYADAFADEDLRPLIRELTSLSGVLSLIAVLDDSTVGHVLLTRCGIDGCHPDIALLGPLAVAPTMQRKGIGSALVREGIDRMAREGVALVCVLGDPGYYGRLGFHTEAQILPPYPLAPQWRAAWQSMHLGEAVPSCRGRIHVPAPWQRPGLWSP